MLNGRLQQLTQRPPTAAKLLLHESRIPVDNDAATSDNGDGSSTDEASDDEA